MSGLEIQSTDDLPWIWLTGSYLNLFFGYPWLASRNFVFMAFGVITLGLGIWSIVGLYLILDVARLLPAHCCHPDEIVDAEIWGACNIEGTFAFYSLDKKVCPQEAAMIRAIGYSIGASFAFLLIVQPIFVRLFLPLLKRIRVRMTPWTVAFTPEAVLAGSHFDLLSDEYKLQKQGLKLGIALFIIGIIGITRFHPAYNAAFSCYVTHNPYQYKHGFCNYPGSDAFEWNSNCYKDGTNIQVPCIQIRRHSYEISIICILVGLFLWLAVWGLGIRLIYLDIGPRKHVPHANFKNSETVHKDWNLFQKRILDFEETYGERAEEDMVLGESKSWKRFVERFNEIDQ